MAPTQTNLPSTTLLYQPGIKPGTCRSARGGPPPPTLPSTTLLYQPGRRAGAFQQARGCPPPPKQPAVRHPALPTWYTTRDMSFSTWWTPPPPKPPCPLPCSTNLVYNQGHVVQHVVEGTLALVDHAELDFTLQQSASGCSGCSEPVSQQVNQSASQSISQFVNQFINVDFYLQLLSFCFT